MLMRGKIEEKIRKKERERDAEVARLTSEIEKILKESEGYIQALTEMLRYAIKEDGDNEVTLRQGSEVAKAKEAIEKAGKPLHVNDLIIAIGKENIKNNRISLSGSLGAYVRKGEIFNRPAPNTFGLLNMSEKQDSPKQEDVSSLPKEET